jgi:hypothetical protein
MAVTTTNTIVSYSGNGSTTAFAVTFQFFAATDITETVFDSGGTDVTGDYAFSYTGGTDSDGLPATGSCTVSPAPASGTTLSLPSVTSKLQSTVYEEGTSFPAKTVEALADRITLLSQEADYATSLVTFTWQGAWVTSTAYAIGDGVQNDGNSYICTADHTAAASTEPGTGGSWETVWDLFASGGATGATGATGDDGTSNIVLDTTPQLGGTLDTNSQQIRWSKGADVASATALTLGIDGNSFDITGTTAIESINTLGVGTCVLLQFDDALTLTHDATDLILPGGANITTAAGDVAMMWEYATGNWKCVAYEPASGESVYDANNAVLDNAQTFTASQRGEVTALTSSSSSIQIDFAASNNFSHTTTEDTTLSNASNIVAGQHGSIVITQDASTPRTMAFGSYWKNAGGTDDTLTATASAVDQINYYVKSSTEIHYNMIKAIS